MAKVRFLCVLCGLSGYRTPQFTGRWGKIADPVLVREDKEVAEVYERGKVPETGKRRVPFLFVESGGVNLALQREKKRRAELKADITCEGWENAGCQDRHRVQEKTISWIRLMETGFGKVSRYSWPEGHTERVPYVKPPTRPHRNKGEKYAHYAIWLDINIPA